VDFLKLVQRKEHKTYNKIVISMVILVVLIISAVIFWPSSPKHQLLAYLSDDVSFYYHWTNKKTLTKDFFGQEASQEVMTDLELALGNNFLNLQELVWFRTGKKQSNNYLLRFSRLPRSFVNDFNAPEQKYKPLILDKNVLLLSSEYIISNLEPREEKNIYFEEGISVYWQKTKAPEFLTALVDLVEPVFVGEEILLNWQEPARGKNRISLLENTTSELKDVKNFLTLKDFDLVFGFRGGIVDNFDIKLLKTFFDTLPYYNLNDEVIKKRILTDTILWQKDDGWILASDRDWQEDILDFIDYFIVEEVPRVLQDGTAYVELVASPNQNIKEHNINGQEVSQIGELFIWNIGDQHYLSNQKKLIENLSSNNQYLGSILDNCLNKQAEIGDFVYIKDRAVLEQITANYLDDYGIEELQMISYTTSTITGLNICF